MSADTAKPFHTLGADETVQTKFTAQIDVLRKTFASGRTKDIKWRESQLRQMLRFLEDHSEALVEAVKSDLSKNRMEALLFDIDFSINDVKGALMDLHEWVQPEPVAKNIMTVMDKPYVWNEPFGVCLVMGAWNYPVQLLVCPAVGAIAAGNAVVFKPSELAPATAEVMMKMTSYLDSEAFLVVKGGVSESTELLKEKFDHIFYTGSVNVGKIVYAAAQKYLTPVVLELGGKSPVYLDSNVDLDIATKRILWGKWVNSGQTCVAPDYVLCHETVYDGFIERAKKAVVDFFGKDPKKAPDYGRIVTSRHTKRLENMLQGTNIVFGGDVDIDEKYVAPTVLGDVKKDDPVMREEIFGPILPVIKVRDMDEAIEYINRRDKPLTSYVFSKDNRVIQRFIKETTAGSVCANDCLVHLSVDCLPFGGVGNSGIGRYHGKYSFECYSNKKAVLVRDFNPIGEFLGAKRYPPYNDTNLNLYKKILAKRSNPFRFVGTVAPYLIGAALGAGAMFLVQYLTITQKSRS